ncbi:putative restriction endonuclease domain-containing protein [Gammaproteobacteria bacterium]
MSAIPAATHIAFRQITVPPGHQVILKDIEWQLFDALLEEGGERRSTRYAYHQGQMEMMSPLAAHEDDKTIIRGIIEILLEELDLEFRALGSTTLKSDRVAQAVEPDECFYIQHEQAVRGKDRLDLNADPPPDLALEIDLTSRTHFRQYVGLGIPELWRYDGRELEILLLENAAYHAASTSRLFPQFDLKSLVPQLLILARLAGHQS